MSQIASRIGFWSVAAITVLVILIDVGFFVGKKIYGNACMNSNVVKFNRYPCISIVS